MPIYTYQCITCGNVEEQFSSIADRDGDKECSKDHRPLQRLVDRPGSVWAPTAGGYR